MVENGVQPTLGPLFDPGFQMGVGDNGAVLLARIDFDIVGNGSANLDFTLLPNGGLQLPDIDLFPSFGTAEFSSSPPNACSNGPPMIPGDFNMNCTVDFGDIAPFVLALTSGVYDFVADMDQNGEVDFMDIRFFIQALSS